MLPKELKQDISNNVSKVLKKKWNDYTTKDLISNLNEDKHSEKDLNTISEILRARIVPNRFSKSAKRQMERERVFDVVPVHFGTKDESYYTEKEMINGYTAPSYDELSESEKLIFNEL